MSKKQWLKSVLKALLFPQEKCLQGCIQGKGKETSVCSQQQQYRHKLQLQSPSSLAGALC